MEKQFEETVTIALKTYLELVEFKREMDKGKTQVFLSNKAFSTLSYITTNEAVKEVIKFNKQMYAESVNTLNENKSMKAVIEKLKTASCRTFREWRSIEQGKL